MKKITILFSLMLSMSSLFAQEEYTWEEASGVTGEVIAAWAVNDAMGVVVSQCSGGTWSAPEVVPGSDLFAPMPIDVVMDTSGNIVLVWGCDSGVVCSSIKLAGQSWTKAVVISHEGEHSTSPRLVLDPTGNASVLWMNQTHGLEASYLPVGTTTWSDPEIISD